MKVSELSALLYAHLRTGENPIAHDGGHWFTRGQMLRDMRHIHDTLRAFGIAPGDRVVLAQVNSYAFVALYSSLLTYGAVVVPVNPNMPVPELTGVVNRSKAVMAFVGTELVDALGAVDSLQGLRLTATAALNEKQGLELSLFAVPRDEPLPYSADARQAVVPVLSHAQSSADPVDALADIADIEEIAETDPAVLLFTSGTTGAPKGVLLTHGQVLAAVRNVVNAHRLTAADVSYCFLPMFHINAQVVALLSTLTTGGRLVIGQKFSASRFWPVIIEHGVTWVSAVPTVIAILIKSTAASAFPASLRFVRSASAPLPALHGRRFEARFGVPVIESYGLTEAASQVCVNPLPPGKHKFGSAGVPYGVELRVVDEMDRVLPCGEVGEMVIRGESVITAYAYGDEAGASFRGGWFHTGDLGYLDEDGYLFITGRSKEMINRAGQKISPREVEEVIGRHAGVKACAVIGLPDDLYGERVVAYVIPEESARRQNASFDASFKEQLRALCVGTVSAYKCPAEFHLVEEIPLGPTGKIQRHRLKQEIMAVGRAN
ncbi:MAG: AMP-binding protein [Bacilli bacterium]